MQRGFAQLLLIVILASVALGAVVYFFILKDEPPEPVQQTTINDDRRVPPTPPTEEEMEQNRIYKDDTLGFEFTTPEGFLVTQESEEEFHKRSNGDMRKNFTSTLYYGPAVFITSLYVAKPNQNLGEAALSVWVFENPDNLTALAFYKKYWYYPFVWGDFTGDRDKIAPTEKIKINEATASSAVVDYQPNSPRFIYLPRDGKMYLFRENGSEEILKSLVFTR